MRLMQNEPGRRGSRPSKDRKQPIEVFSGGPGSTPAVWGGVRRLAQRSSPTWNRWRDGAGHGYGDSPEPALREKGFPAHGNRDAPQPAATRRGSRTSWTRIDNWKPLRPWAPTEIPSSCRRGTRVLRQINKSKCPQQKSPWPPPPFTRPPIPLIEISIVL